ncbi:hypothetical protein [Mucilaginibacter sp.]|uniref:hypothetical protein n=1 Tax=Mucilaginibacter sp. TaxID=1882438 RepID=UPI000CB4BEA7|nr:hypothetical protein [Mucilaginibacter sp.]PLW91309.1 MAG: hypothetical protein C0154_01830 [Mucilaginibacter sp.]HEK21394.1 hypothetical protein [Bacteroidota bacterium]
MLNEFWNFYTGLFSNENLAIRIGAFAATVAAITFLLNFVFKPTWAYIKDYFSKISAVMGISHLLVHSAYGVGYDAPLLTVTITNKDRISKYIKNPSIKTSAKINGDNLFVVPKKQGTYPMKLEPGQQTTIEFDTQSLNNQILSRLSNNDKISAVVTDTTGKKYYSNKFTVKHILGHISVAKEMNR